MLKNLERAATRQPKVPEMSAMEALGSALRFLRRQFWVIISTTFLLSTLGVVYALITPPTYTAKALLVTDSKRLQLTQSFGEATIDPLELETEVEVLKSDNVLLPVVKELRLTDHPGFEETLGLRAKLFGSGGPITEASREQHALQVLLDTLSATRLPRTRIIEISFKSREPAFAAQLVNAVANSFIHEQFESRAQGAGQASAWLESRVKELGVDASRAEQAVVKFKRENNIVDTGGKLTAEQQLGEINTKLINARAETAEARAKLARIDTTLAHNRGDATLNATVADTLKNEVVNNLRSQYFVLANREADYSARYGKDHLAVVKLRTQMRGIRNSILDELQRLAEVYKSDLEIAKHKEEQLEKEYSTAVANTQATSQSQIKLRELEGAARTNRALYDNFLARYLEQVQQQSMKIGDARLISPASQPQKPSNKKILPIALASFGGLALGLAIAVLRDMSDRAFRTGQQIEKSLRTKCIALVPRLDADAASRPGGRTAEGEGVARRAGGEAPAGRDAGGSKGARKVISRRRSPATAIIDAPFSRFADEFHSIKLAADRSGSTGSSKVIGVTSALPGEGKSTIAVNLARLIARTGARTALVDCDFRKPELSKLLAPGADNGLCEVVGGAASLVEAFWKDDLSELMFLPAGARAGLVHPNEILASDAAPKIFENLRQLYNWVIVDLPSIGPVPDVQSTIRFVDSYLLVVEWGRTDPSTVEHALDRAKGVDDCLLGALLNKVDMSRLSTYDPNYVVKLDKEPDVKSVRRFPRFWRPGSWSWLNANRNNS